MFINSVHDWIFEENTAKPYEILCGDFNDDPDSSIYQYLTNNLWIDVAQFIEGVASGKCGFTTLRKSKYKKPNFSV